MNRIEESDARQAAIRQSLSMCETLGGTARNIVSNRPTVALHHALPVQYLEPVMHLSEVLPPLPRFGGRGLG